MYKAQSVIEGTLQELKEDHGGTVLTGLLRPAHSFQLAPSDSLLPACSVRLAPSSSLHPTRSFQLAPSGSLLPACSPCPLTQQAHFPRDGAAHSGLSPPTAQQLRKCLTDVLTCQPVLGDLPAESPSPHVKPDHARLTPGADYVRLEGRGRKIQMLTDSQQVLGSITDPAAG